MNSKMNVISLNYRWLAIEKYSINCGVHYGSKSMITTKTLVIVNDHPLAFATNKKNFNASSFCKIFRHKLSISTRWTPSFHKFNGQLEVAQQTNTNWYNYDCKPNILVLVTWPHSWSIRMSIERFIYESDSILKP